jgi:hypothetical protein
MLSQPAVTGYLAGSCGNKTDGESLSEYSEAHPAKGIKHCDAEPTSGVRLFSGFLWK